MENKITPYYVIDAYEKPAAIKKYTASIADVGLWESEKKIITQFVNIESNILELGCGAGRVSYNLYKLGYKNITGIDLSKNMISSAKKYAFDKNADIKYYVDDAMNLSFKECTYDCVLFMFNGLMLIPGLENRIKVLKEVKRVLNKNGIFIFTSHDINGNKEYKEFWKNEEENWKLGKNDKKLYEYGDLIDKEIEENDSFIHFPSDDEIYMMASQLEYDIIFSEFRDSIVQENEKVKNFSENNKFWIFRK